MHYHCMIQLMETLHYLTASSTEEMSAGCQKFLSVLPLPPNYKTSDDQLDTSPPLLKTA